MLLSVRIAPRQRVAQILHVGETSGDIPLYSLHRIRNLFRKQPPAIDPKIQTILLQNLIGANAAYKEASGKDWSCITSNGLVDAIEETDRTIAWTIDGIEDIPRECARIRDRLLQKLHEGRQGNVLVIKRWFESNFDALQYDMRGHIPYAVVLRLRRGLSQWIAGISNPFAQDVRDMVREVAVEQGVQAKSAEEAWKKMGGKLFVEED